MANGVVHRSLDGYRYRLSGDLDLTRPFSSVARFAVDGRLRELTSGTIEATAGWTEDLGIRGFDDEFAVQGGRLGTARVTSRDKRIGLEDHLLAVVWQGRKFSMFVPMYNAKPADAVRLFQLLALTEHEDGLTASSRDPRRAGIAEPADLAKEVPGVGLLEITALTKTTTRRLPAWTGARVGQGELFRDTLDDGTTYFLYSTSSALVTVLPHGDETTAAAGRLADLTVETLDR